MAFRLVSSGGNVVEPTVVNLLATGAVSLGDMVHFNGGETVRSIRRANSAGAERLFGISAGSVNSGTKYINVIPINNVQIWEADTTANTSVSYIGFTVGASTYAYLNGATNASGTTAIFRILGNVGAVGDKKVIGQFILRTTGE